MSRHAASFDAFCREDAIRSWSRDNDEATCKGSGSGWRWMGNGDGTPGTRSVNLPSARSASEYLRDAAWPFPCGTLPGGAHRRDAGVSAEPHRISFLRAEFKADEFGTSATSSRGATSGTSTAGPATFRPDRRPPFGHGGDRNAGPNQGFPRHRPTPDRHPSRLASSTPVRLDRVAGSAGRSPGPVAHGPEPTLGGPGSCRRSPTSCGRRRDLAARHCSSEFLQMEAGHASPGSRGGTTEASTVRAESRLASAEWLAADMGSASTD